ncbi:MAG: hypothetical protein QG559_1053, partial [Campylobacterota bacterium]|nr:hypothetical protein [Campylobacterota bacterium]
TGVREQADIAKGKADVATIRAAIVNERQRRLIQGDATWITTANLDTGGELFGGVLTTPMKNENSASHWYNNSPGDGTYTYTVGSTATTFTYEDTNGTFSCTSGSAKCDELTD